MRTPAASALPAVRWRCDRNHVRISAKVMNAVTTIAVSCSGRVSGSGTFAPGAGRLLENKQVTTAEIVVELVVEAVGDDPPAVGRPGRVAAHLVRLVQEDLVDDAAPGMPGGQQRAGLDARIVRALVSEVAGHIAEGQRVDLCRAAAGQIQRLIEDGGQLPEHGLDVARIGERAVPALIC